jgi:hypothetical protein
LPAQSEGDVGRDRRHDDLVVRVLKQIGDERRDISNKEYKQHRY